MKLYRCCILGVLVSAAWPAGAQQQQSAAGILPPPPPKVTQSNPLTAVMPAPVTAPPADRTTVMPNVVADPTKFSPVAPVTVDPKSARTPTGTPISHDAVAAGSASTPASAWDKLNAPATNVFTAPILKANPWNAPGLGNAPSVNWQNTGTPASQWK